MVLFQTDEVELVNELREVIIISMFGNCEDISVDVMKHIARTMHANITGHSNFTSMSQIRSILLEAFKNIGKMISNMSSIKSKLSYLTAVISGNEICLANSGECGNCI